jgi:hypothetical protein
MEPVEIEGQILMLTVTFSTNHGKGAPAVYQYVGPAAYLIYSGADPADFTGVRIR